MNSAGCCWREFAHRARVDVIGPIDPEPFVNGSLIAQVEPVASPSEDDTSRP
jgi:hypothetical protein